MSRQTFKIHLISLLTYRQIQLYISQRIICEILTGNFSYTHSHYLSSFITHANSDLAISTKWQNGPPVMGEWASIISLKTKCNKNNKGSLFSEQILLRQTRHLEVERRWDGPRLKACSKTKKKTLCPELSAIAAPHPAVAEFRRGRLKGSATWRRGGKIMHINLSGPQGRRVKKS